MYDAITARLEQLCARTPTPLSENLLGSLFVLFQKLVLVHEPARMMFRRSEKMDIIFAMALRLVVECVNASREPVR